MKRDDDKGLLNEVLPAPTKPDRASPRERAAAHLKRVLAAAATLAIGAAHADSTVPEKGKGDKKGNETRKPDKPRESLGYEVVDMLPPPHIDEKKREGFLSINTMPPGAAVMIDGRPVGPAPIAKLKLTVGLHAVTLTTAEGGIKNFTVDIKAGETLKQSHDLKGLKPPPPPAKAKDGGT
jgi:hypothetical protein